MVLQNTRFNVNNFNKDNTPPWLAKIGNWCLVIGGLGAVTAILPVSAGVAATVGAWIAVVGLVGKIISKTGGEVKPATNE